MRYDCLLADADGTLFNFHAGERLAIRATLGAFGLPSDDGWIARYSRINDGHWKKLERSETTQKRLRVERFADLLTAFRAEGYVADGLTPEQVGERFVAELAKQRIPLTGAEDFLRQVSAAMPVYLVTNGIAVVQRSRFEQSELRKYMTDLLISEEIGAAKPDPAILFEAVKREAERTGRTPAPVMLGDSLTADIAAARNARIDSIWFTNGAPITPDHGATYAVQTLEEAARLLLD